MKPPRDKIPQPDVLAWLQQHHPELHETAELDRAWLWITVNLSGDHNKPLRESIKAFGFRFKKGFHQLPSGKLGTWGHACSAPLPFRRNKTNATKPSTSAAVEQNEEVSPEVLAFLGM